MSNNEKKEYFAKVAGKRVPAALEAIRAIKGFTKDTYAYTDEQAAEIIAALRAEVDSLSEALLPGEKDAQKAVRSNICMVTETTISGSGGFDDCAQELIRIRGQMDAEKKEELAAELARIKRNSSDECLDTDEMVADACNKVFGEGNWELLDYNEVVF